MAQIIEFVTNHYILSLIWLFLVGALVVDFYRTKVSPVKPVKPPQATQLINREEAVIVDIRGDSEYRKGHIAGARQISAQAVEKGEFGKLESVKDKPLIVVCSSGTTSGKASRQLAKAGFERVYLLDGGMQAWTGASMPVVSK